MTLTEWILFVLLIAAVGVAVAVDLSWRTSATYSFRGTCGCGREVMIVGAHAGEMTVTRCGACGTRYRIDKRGPA